jgi:hypothetical protein
MPGAALIPVHADPNSESAGMVAVLTDFKTLGFRR